jgi:perosamine synthetase
MIPHNRYVTTDEDRAAVARVLDSGHVAQGPEVEALERELEERFGRPAAVVSSGTAALYLALKVSGVWSGECVLIPTYACTALYHAVRMTGASVELGDVRPDTFNPDPAFKTRHRPNATIYVHTYGVPGPVPQGDRVISDVTHALGASYDGVPVTMMGDLAVASLGPTKLLACPGAGVVFGSEDRIARVKDLRDYDGKAVLKERGNWQTSDLHAAIARARLARFDADMDRRRMAACSYGLSANEPAQRSSIVRASRSWYRYVIGVSDPGHMDPWVKAQRQFAAAGVETINPLRPDELLHRQLGEDRKRFPAAERVAHHTLSLPCYPSLKDEEVSRVCDVLGRLEA